MPSSKTCAPTFLDGYLAGNAAGKPTQVREDFETFKILELNVSSYRMESAKKKQQGTTK